MLMFKQAAKIMLYEKRIIKNVLFLKKLNRWIKKLYSCIFLVIILRYISINKSRKLQSAMQKTTKTESSVKHAEVVLAVILTLIVAAGIYFTNIKLW